MFKHCPFTKWGEYNHKVVIQLRERGHHTEGIFLYIGQELVENWLQENDIYEYTRRSVSLESSEVVFWFKYGEDAVYFAMKWVGK